MNVYRGGGKVEWRTDSSGCNLLYGGGAGLRESTTLGRGVGEKDETCPNSVFRNYRPSWLGLHFT
jgi:hypothetical protein